MIITQEELDNYNKKGYGWYVLVLKCENALLHNNTKQIKDYTTIKNYKYGYKL